MVFFSKSHHSSISGHAFKTEPERFIAHLALESVAAHF